MGSVVNDWTGGFNWDGQYPELVWLPTYSPQLSSLMHGIWDKTATSVWYAYMTLPNLHLPPGGTDLGFEFKLDDHSWWDGFNFLGSVAGLYADHSHFTADVASLGGATESAAAANSALFNATGDGSVLYGNPPYPVAPGMTFGQTGGIGVPPGGQGLIAFDFEEPVHVGDAQFFVGDGGRRLGIMFSAWRLLSGFDHQTDVPAHPDPVDPGHVTMKHYYYYEPPPPSPYVVAGMQSAGIV